MSFMTTLNWEQQQTGTAQRTSGTTRHAGMSTDARTARIVSGQMPINDESSRDFQEKHVVKKLLLILAMMVVIGQLVWWIGK